MHGLGQLLHLHILMCLWQFVHGSKIIHGEIAPENLMQYMVSVQSKEGHHACGGFLISEDIVVTAAHCALPQPDVLLGSHNLMSSNIRKIHVDSICKHPNYTDLSNGHDIMLLKLSENALPDNRVKIIPLPSSEIPQRDKEICSVAGWGKTERSNNGIVKDLRVVNVSVVNSQICEKKWKNKLPPNVICAGGYYGNKGFCQGDSGGPLVCNGTAVGVVSFNRSSNCNYPDFPNVYTDISKYLPWINSILKQKKCSF